jgi:hypothetical protein
VAEVGERVALLEDVIGYEGEVIARGEVGIVTGHRGQEETCIRMDDGRGVVILDQKIRVVQATPHRGKR